MEPESLEAHVVSTGNKVDEMYALMQTVVHNQEVLASSVKKILDSVQKFDAIAEMFSSDDGMGAITKMLGIH